MEVVGGEHRARCRPWWATEYWGLGQSARAGDGRVAATRKEKNPPKCKQKRKGKFSYLRTARLLNGPSVLMGSRCLWFCVAMVSLHWRVFNDLVARIMREHQIEERFIVDYARFVSAPFYNMAMSARSVVEAVNVWNTCQVCCCVERVEEYPRELLDSLGWHIARYSKGPTPVPGYFRTEHETCLELCKEFIASSSRSLPDDVAMVVAKTFVDEQLTDQFPHRRDTVFETFARYGGIPVVYDQRRKIQEALEEMLPLSIYDK